MTARDSVDSRVAGLDIGADDYMVKPYDLQELLARMRPVLGRRDGSAHSGIGSEGLQLDLTAREVLLQGERAQRSAREFALLHALLERPGAMLSRAQLENRIYGWGEEVSNAVDVLIHGTYWGFSRIASVFMDDHDVPVRAGCRRHLRQGLIPRGEAGCALSERHGQRCRFHPHDPGAQHGAACVGDGRQADDAALARRVAPPARQRQGVRIAEWPRRGRAFGLDAWSWDVTGHADSGSAPGCAP